MSKETITVEVRSEVALAYLNAPAEQQKKCPVYLKFA